MATMARRKAVPPRAARVPTPAPESTVDVAVATATLADSPPDVASTTTAAPPEISVPDRGPAAQAAPAVAQAPPPTAPPADCRHTVTRTRSRAGKLWRYCEACGYELTVDQAPREVLRPLTDVLGTGGAGLGQGR